MRRSGSDELLRFVTISPPLSPPSASTHTVNLVASSASGSALYSEAPGRCSAHSPGHNGRPILGRPYRGPGSLRASHRLMYQVPTMFTGTPGYELVQSVSPGPRLLECPRQPHQGVWLRAASLLRRYNPPKGPLVGWSPTTSAGTMRPCLGSPTSRGAWSKLGIAAGARRPREHL